jgi:hypothetical protein
VSGTGPGGYGPVVPSLFGRITKFAQSPQGRRLADQAKRRAEDPATQRKLKQLLSRRKPR